MDASSARLACPGRDQLAAFHRGVLPSAELESVAAHLERCPDCSAVLEKLADEEVCKDPLLAGLLRIQATPVLVPVLPSAAPGPGARPGDSSSEYTSISVPKQVREYRLLEKLGQGGMGTVYRALHTRLDRPVAVKVVAQGCMARPEALARFRREMKAVGRLRHPNIVEATDAGEEAGVHFLVMELVDGTDLARLLDRLGRLPIAEACELVRQAALALEHAHGSGLVHRDVKPSNLMLTAGGVVKLLDLGLALLHGDQLADERAASSDVLLGTFDYIAPEQGDDPHRVDARADLYSLGCTLYHLLTGRPPFPSPAYCTPLQKLAAHKTLRPPPLRDLRPDVPAALGMRWWTG